MKDTATAVASCDWQQRMLDASIDCIKVLSPDGLVSHMNRSGRVALGLPLDETEFGMPWLQLLPAPIRPRGRRALRVAREGRVARFAGMSIAPGEEARHWDNILTPLTDADGGVTAILCVSRDVTAQREVERRLRKASERDELTGLLNRRAFKTRMRRELLRIRNQQGTIGVLLLDLDYFKQVNDTHGHAAGDHLLRTIARRIERGVPERSVVARLGGDEFAVAIRDLDAVSIGRAALDLLGVIAHPVRYHGHSLAGASSIGYALSPDQGTDLATLLHRADLALGTVKATQRGQARGFTSQPGSSERLTKLTC